MTDIPTIELYPPQVHILLCGAEGKPLIESSHKLFISNVNKLTEVEDKIKYHYQITETFTRLWFKPAGEEWTKSIQLLFTL